MQLKIKLEVKEGIMRRVAIILLIILQFILIQKTFAELSSITNGLNYLTSTQNPDGSWGNETSETDILPSTFSVMETFQLLNQTSSQNYTNGLFWLQNQPLDITEYLSERIHLLLMSGADSDLLISYFNELFNAWGGFNDGYKANNYDTTLALQALKATSYSDQNIISAALYYLTSNQNPDGGWGFRPSTGSGQAEDSEVYYTALVLSTLQQFSLTTTLATAINKATSYLIAHQNPDGGFGSGGVNLAPTSTVFETALVYIALAGMITDNTVLGNEINYLISMQSSDGSWLQDPYSTALALRALYLSENRPIPPLPPDKGTVTGKVVDASTNQTLNNVSVEAVSVQPPANTSTDNTGSFTLSNIPQGNQTITFSLSGYTALSTTINITAGSIHDLGTIVLSASPATGMIRGAVTDASNNQPIEGATITVTGSYSGTALTGTDGSFIFNGVTPGTVTITASKTGYYTISATGTVAAGMIINFNPKLSTQPPAATTGNLTGRILSASTNSPIQGAMISLSGGPSTTTDAQGMFLINDIAPGIYQVTISSSGYTGQIYQVVIAAGVTTDMQTIYLAPASQATMGNIIGRVYDGSTNTPLPAASIVLSGGPSTATDTQGVFLINDISPNTYQVTISASGYISQTSQVAITAGITTNIQTVYLIAAPQSTTVTGRVTDAATGDPIAGAEVTVVGMNFSTKTDAGGTYTITGINLYEFDLKASHAGYDSTGYHVKTSAYGTFSLNLVLNPTSPGDIRIQLLATDGRSYPADTGIAISAQIENRGTEKTAVHLFAQIVDPLGTVVDVLHPTSPPTYVISLSNDHLIDIDPMSTVSATFLGNTYQFAPGNYEVLLKAVDPLTETVLAEAAVSIAIVPSKKVRIIRITPSPTFSHVGATETVSLSLLFADLSNVPVQMEISHSMTTPGGIVLLSGSETIEKEPDAMALKLPLGALTYTFTEQGAYPIDVTIISGGETLATATGALVISPTVRVEPSTSLIPDTVLPDGDKRIKVRIELKGVQQ